MDGAQDLALIDKGSPSHQKKGSSESRGSDIEMLCAHIQNETIPHRGVEDLEDVGYYSPGLSTAGSAMPPDPCKDDKRSGYGLQQGSTKGQFLPQTNLGDLPLDYIDHVNNESRRFGVSTDEDYLDSRPRLPISDVLTEPNDMAIFHTTLQSQSLMGYGSEDQDEDTASVDGDYHPDLREDDVFLITAPPHPSYAPYCPYPIKALSTEARQFLSGFLNQTALAMTRTGLSKNWEGLAQCTGRDASYVFTIEELKDPCGILLKDWQKQEQNSNIGLLLNYLKSIERVDIIESEVFWKLIDESVETYNREREEHAKEAESRHISRERQRSFRRSIRTTSQVNSGHSKADQFDAYVCYDERDTEFIKELIYELEHEENLKLCINARDLPIGDEDFVAAELIKSRCKRTLVVLSENFVRSGNPLCDFALKIAQSLSPSASDNKLIPIRLDQCDIPASLLHMSIVDFGLCRVKPWLWGRLSATLKLPEQDLRLVEKQKLRRVKLPSDCGSNIDVRASMRETAYIPPLTYVSLSSGSSSPSVAAAASSSSDIETSELRLPPGLSRSRPRVPSWKDRLWRTFLSNWRRGTAIRR